MQGFDYKELFLKFRYPILILLVGAILVGGGIILTKTSNFSGTKVEVLGGSTETVSTKEITIEITGAVISAGVYKLTDGSRVNDLLVAAGGFSKDTDRVWTDKYLNRASKLTDGQKVYIPSINQQKSDVSANGSGVDQNTSSVVLSDSNSLININTASLGQLDGLPGIGPVFGQNIVEHRPYSTVEELVSKGAIKQTVFNKLKDKVSVY